MFFLIYIEIFMINRKLYNNCLIIFVIVFDYMLEILFYVIFIKFINIFILFINYI